MTLPQVLQSLLRRVALSSGGLLIAGVCAAEPSAPETDPAVPPEDEDAASPSRDEPETSPSASESGATAEDGEEDSPAEDPIHPDATGYEPDQHGVKDDGEEQSEIDDERQRSDAPVDLDLGAASPDGAPMEPYSAHEDEEVSRIRGAWLLVPSVGWSSLDFSPLAEPSGNVDAAQTGVGFGVGFGRQYRAHTLFVAYERYFYDPYASNAALLRYRWQPFEGAVTPRIGLNGGYTWLSGAGEALSGPTLGAELGLALQVSPALELGTGIDARLWFVDSDPPLCVDCASSTTGYRLQWTLDALFRF